MYLSTSDRINYFRIYALCLDLAFPVGVLTRVMRAPSEKHLRQLYNIASEATSSTDKATAAKRISTFLRLCHLYIPCERDDYEGAVYELEQEVSPDLRTAKLTLEVVQEQIACHRQG